jgi:hypothetical protein
LNGRLIIDLRFCRVQHNLQKAWHPLMTLRRASHHQYALAKQLMNLRHRMGTLVDNISYFMQMDVVDANFSQFQTFVQNSGDFEAVLQQHAQFVDTLCTLVLSGRGVVFRTMEDIFAISLDFCSLVNRISRAPNFHTIPSVSTDGTSFSVSSSISTSPTAAMAKLGADFDRLTALLFTVISGVSERHSSAYLGQLLLRVRANNMHCTIVEIQNVFVKLILI